MSIPISQFIPLPPPRIGIFFEDTDLHNSEHGMTRKDCVCGGEWVSVGVYLLITVHSLCPVIIGEPPRDLLQLFIKL